MTIAAQFIFVINLFWSMFKGPKASDNPWEATTLEWTTATPPPHDNFGGKTPVVYHGPYEYSVPGAPKDYVMQTDPATACTISTSEELPARRGRPRPQPATDMATFSSTVTITDPVVKDPKTGRGSGGTRPPVPGRRWRRSRRQWLFRLR